MTRLNAAQVEQLLQPIKPHRVLHANGQSHVPAYDVAAHLTRVLGFGGWDKEILSLMLVSEEQGTTSGGKPAWEVTYACTLRLTIKDERGITVASWDDGACGTSKQPQKGEAHDMAMKSAISYALKRCAAFGLGDQFGLSLYNKGNTSALIGTTLVRPDGTMPNAEKKERGWAIIDLESHIPVPQSMGNDETDSAIDPIEDLAAALRATALTKTEQKTFVEGAIGHSLAHFTDLTPEEAERSLVALRIAMTEGDE